MGDMEDWMEDLVGPEPTPAPEAPAKSPYSIDKELSYYDDQDNMRKQAEMVPLDVLNKMKEYERRPGERHNSRTPEQYEALKQHIATHGVTSPVWIDYHPELGVGHISEGNHRLAIAEDLGLTHLPAVVYHSRRKSKGASLPLTYKGEMAWDGYHPEYMRPSDFPELQSEPNPAWKLSAYTDFEPSTGFPQNVPPQQWDERREEWLPREGGGMGMPPSTPFWGGNQNDYSWDEGQTALNFPGYTAFHPDHVDENLLPEHWKDNFVGKDERAEWQNPMDALRAHAEHLAQQHGINTVIHPEWTDTTGRTDYADTVGNEVHVRPVTNRMRYLVKLHEIGHNIGGTPGMPVQDWRMNRGTGMDEPRIPLNYELGYKPKGWELHDDGRYIGPEGEDPTDPGFRYPSEWEHAPKQPETGAADLEDDAPPVGFFPDDSLVPTSPYSDEENKLETEARAWDWAIQHSAIKVTPQLLRQMYRYLGTYADPKQIANYSPTFKRLWNEGEHPESGEGWADPTQGDWADRQRKRYKYDTDKTRITFPGPEPERPTAAYMPYVPSKAPVSRSKTILADLRVIPPAPPSSASESLTARLASEDEYDWSVPGKPPGVVDSEYSQPDDDYDRVPWLFGKDKKTILLGEPGGYHMDIPGAVTCQHGCGVIGADGQAVAYNFGGNEATMRAHKALPQVQKMWEERERQRDAENFYKDDPRYARTANDWTPLAPGQELPTEHKWIYNPETDEFHTWGGAQGSTVREDEFPTRDPNTDFRQRHHHDEARQLGWVGPHDLPSQRTYWDGMYYTDPTPGQTYWGAFRDHKPEFAQVKDRIHEHIQQDAGQPIPHETNRLSPLEGLMGRGAPKFKWGEPQKVGASGGADHKGAMVALMLRPADAKKLYVPHGEPTDDMHITLVFFKDKGADRDDWADLYEPLTNIAREYGKLEGEVGGTGSFASKDGKEPFFATPDVPHLAELHTAIKDACDQAGFPVSTEHGFNPHITLRYLEEGDEFPQVDLPSPLEFDGITLMVADKPKHFKFEGENVKTSDWREEDHPREGQTGKFTVKHDQHEVKVHDKKGKHLHTVKRCNKCGVLYGEKPGKEVTSCPTCGEHPRRQGGATIHRLHEGVGQNAVADSLGWRYWKDNENQHKMYQWTGENQYGEIVPHTVTGYGAHGDQDWHGQKLRKQMRSCMAGTCDHVALPGAQLHDIPGTPVLRAGAEVVYGGQRWWIMDVDGSIAHIYNDTGREEIVPATELKAASTWQSHQ